MEPALKKLKPLFEEETNTTYIGNEWIESFFQLPKENRLKILSKLLLPELLDFHTVAALGSESDNRWIQMFENVNLWKYVYAEYFPHSRFKGELPIFLKTVQEGMVTRELLTSNRKKYFPILTPYHGVPSLKPKYGRETLEQEDHYNELMKWRSFVIFCHKNALQIAKQVYKQNKEMEGMSALKDISYQNIKRLIPIVAKLRASIVLKSTVFDDSLPREAITILYRMIDNPPDVEKLDDLKHRLAKLDEKNDEDWRTAKMATLVRLYAASHGDFLLFESNTMIYAQLIVSRFTESNSINFYDTNFNNYRALLLQIKIDFYTRAVVKSDSLNREKAFRHAYLLEKFFPVVVHKVLFGFLKPHPTDESRRIISIGKPIQCAWCNQTGALLVCSQCKSVVYCNRECQTQDWSVAHQHQCIN